MKNEERKENKGGKKRFCIIEMMKRMFTTKTDTKEKNMNEIVEDFFNGLSQKLQDFYKVYREWWTIKTMLNNSFPDLSREDIAFWYCMQIYAENQVNQFAKKLPDDGKEFIKTLKEKMGVKQ